MKSLLDKETLSEITNRFGNLDNQTNPKWGKMKASQMVKHCQISFEVLNGTVKMETKVSFIKKIIFSMMKPLMYNDKPWRKNVPTPKEFIISGEVNFTNERETLLNLIHDFHKRKNQSEWPKHPVFGKFTGEQYGKMNYKHLDHHLSQFGV